MHVNLVEEVIKDNYHIEFNNIKKIKNVYKIDNGHISYCLKVIKYDFNHFLFILNCIKHLQHNGFNKIPKIIQTKNNKDYIKIENNYAYMTPWINSRECNYNNPVDIATAACELGQLHKRSKGFYLTKDMNPRIGWFKWPNTFNTRIKEILDFKDRIFKKYKMDEFDKLYLDVMEEEINIARDSINSLLKTEYFNKMSEEIKLKGFCHHDFAHHNVLIDKSGGVNIIDFDYCILDSKLHDLSSLMIRVMKNGKWDIDISRIILNSYSKEETIDERDLPIMASFIEFPQDYWQIGIQYYWEQQPWSKEFFINKLKKIEKDIEDRQEFVDDFRRFKY